MGKIAKVIVGKRSLIEKKSLKHVKRKLKDKRSKINIISNEKLSESLLDSLNLTDTTDNTSDETQHSEVVKKTKKGAKSRIEKKSKKKDKLNIKKKLLMKKIDLVKEMKKEQKIREKRKNTAIIGDTNPLHDALPSIEPLLKMKRSAQIKPEEKYKKKKCIEKAAKRKKQTMSDIEAFKRAMNDETYKTNPYDSISEHVQRKNAPILGGKHIISIF